MSSNLSINTRSSLEYQIALDAASVWLSDLNLRGLVGGDVVLRRESHQRLRFQEEPPWRGILWLEPQERDWEMSLQKFSSELLSGNKLAIILSLSPAKRLPERGEIQDSPLGFERGGLKQLSTRLIKKGFDMHDINYLHTGRSIGLNQLAEFARRLHLFALGDRLGFIAKKYYIKRPKGLGLATCALITATKK
jgi:hypothetical protein